MDASGRAQDGARTTELTGAVGDRCASCNAPLALDQRYCVGCGEARGRPRFSYETLAARAAAGPAESLAPPSSRTRRSSGTTLVAGVATLLIALGVGVLIGHSSTSGSSPRAAVPQVITVPAAAGAATAAAGGTASGGAATPAAHGKAAKTKVTHVALNAKSTKAASSGAAKVLGSDHSLSKNLQQQVGGSCAGGAGCQGGTFSGNYFPGG